MVTDEEEYDVVVIGGGMAGMAAAITANEKGFKTLVLEKWILGGYKTSLSRDEKFFDFKTIILDLGIDVLENSAVETPEIRNDKLVSTLKR